MAMTLNDKNRLNNDFHPTAQSVRMGDAVFSAPVIFEYAITADASDGDLPAFTAPFAMRLTDITVRATAASASGTVTPKKGTTAMCTAIACAVDKAVTSWSAGVEAAQIVLAAGDVVNVETNGAADRGVVAFTGVRL